MGLPVEATALGLSPREGSGPDEKFVSGPTTKVVWQKKNLYTKSEKLTAE